MKFTLSLVLDLFFFSLISFCISVAWLRYFLSNTFLIVTLSCIIALFVAFLLIIVKLKKEKTTLFTKRQKNELAFLKKSLLTSDLNHSLNFLENIFILRKNSNKLYKNYNTFCFEKFNNFFVGTNCVYCVNFDKIKIDEQTIKTIILNITKNSQNTINKNIKDLKTIYVLANDFMEGCNEFINLFNIKIKLITLNTFYKEIVCGLNIFDLKETPKINHLEKIKNFRKSIFNSTQTKPFLMCGICIFIAGFIVRYNIYYIIFSSLLFLFAIICRIKKTAT